MTFEIFFQYPFFLLTVANLMEEKGFIMSKPTMNNFGVTNFHKPIFAIASFKTRLD